MLDLLILRLVRNMRDATPYQWLRADLIETTRHWETSRFILSSGYQVRADTTRNL